MISLSTTVSGEPGPADFPQEQLEGLTEQNSESEIVTWARFKDPSGHRWEVVWDPQTRTQSIHLLT